MNQLQKLFGVLFNTQEAVLPVFLHNPATQRIGGMVLFAESVFLEIVAGAGSVPGEAQGKAA